MHVGHGVGKLLNEERFHLLKNSRVNRRGGCIVQVDYSLHSIPPELACCSYPRPDKGQRYPESERSILLKVTEFPSVSPSTDSIPDVAPDIHMTDAVPYARGTSSFPSSSACTVSSVRGASRTVLSPTTYSRSGRTRMVSRLCVDSTTDLPFAVAQEIKPCSSRRLGRSRCSSGSSIRRISVHCATSARSITLRCCPEDISSRKRAPKPLTSENTSG